MLRQGAAALKREGQGVTFGGLLPGSTHSCFSTRSQFIFALRVPSLGTSQEHKGRCQEAGFLE